MTKHTHHCLRLPPVRKGTPSSLQMMKALYLENEVAAAR